jgi:hypothetical protein
MTTTKFLRNKEHMPWRSRVAAAFGLSLLMVATAFGQFKRIPGTAQSNMVPCPVAGYTCYPQSIAAGPKRTAWVLGTAQTSAGDYYAYERLGSEWVQSDGAGLQIAVSPKGYAWVITHLGTIYYWNGEHFVPAPGNGCATSIGVTEETDFQYGQPWIIGCDGSSTTDGSIYYLHELAWVMVSGAAANRIAVSPQGVTWVITAAGSVFYGGVDGFSAAPAGCATSIAVGSVRDPLAGPYGDGWITGCGDVNNEGSKIFQLQNGTSWVQIPGVASQISVSPHTGVAWVVTLTGEIFEN